MEEPYFVAWFSKNSVARSTAPAIAAHKSPIPITAVDASGLEGNCTCNVRISLPRADAVLAPPNRRNTYTIHHVMHEAHNVGFHPAAVISRRCRLAMPVEDRIRAELWVKDNQGLDHEELCDDASYGCSARQNLDVCVWYLQPLLVESYRQCHSQGGRPYCLQDRDARTMLM